MAYADLIGRISNRLSFNTVPGIMEGKHLKDAKQLKLNEVIALFVPETGTFVPLKVIKRRFSTNTIIVLALYRARIHPYYNLFTEVGYYIRLPSTLVFQIANVPSRDKVEMEIMKRKAEGTLCPAAQP